MVVMISANDFNSSEAKRPGMCASHNNKINDEVTNEAQTISRLNDLPDRTGANNMKDSLENGPLISGSLKGKSVGSVAKPHSIRFE
jgi:hypothetical protein